MSVSDPDNGGSRTPTRDQIVATCDRYISALAVKDVDAIMAVFAPDATQEEPAGTPPRVGHDAIRRFFEEAASIPFTVRRLGPITVHGRVAAFQVAVLFEGTDNPPMTSTDVVTVDAAGLLRSIVAIPDGDAHPEDSGPAPLGA